ncbi:hypothetical protein C1752_13893 [Acaryochloris thomasi RCC1774]|uniref:GEVED domain-containing protein n=1 Tax=Acaryochloris thomasi RCC1774 TaxID=1764569 RepID=A0A2W1J859_9CYAN|nr:GEVED domain-containing protein [Acaryochloris thomasi]PZD70358.1 hypothetical protein C1752_13893 [Acaryochloris thomasi RCC1774]
MKSLFKQTLQNSKSIVGLDHNRYNLVHDRPQTNSRGRLASTLSSLGLGAIILLASAIPAWGEGSQQLGRGDQGLNVFLFEYNAANGFIQGTNRGIQVNVENPGDVINVSLCGWSLTDTTAIRVFRPSGAPLDYNNQVAAGSPGFFDSAVTAWRLAGSNAQTASQATLCNNQDNPDSAVGNLTTPVRFIASEAGTYEINLFNTSQGNGGGSNNVFTYFDITVTSSASVNPDPNADNGQIWATSWAFNAGNTFFAPGGYDADLYIRTPGGRPNTEFIWQLDLNNFAPQRHEIVANSIGLNPPNSRTSALGSSGASFAREFPIYLAPPNSSSAVLPVLPEPASPNLTNLRFFDNNSQDNSISPNSTTNVQDSGFFQFDLDVAGTYRIIIDTNDNRSFDNGDRVLFGSATAGANAVEWDGRGINAAVLPSGTYPAQVSIGLGEYHFVAFDAETSGGGTNNGLAIWDANGSNPRTPVLNHWDDSPIAGTRNLVGALSNTPAGRHTWGNFSSGGIGNTNFIDTWVFGNIQDQETQTIIADTDDNDFGDAPDTYGTDTDITVGGIPASHLISANLHLGTVAPDLEADGQPTSNADGDDNNGTAPDDEEGVNFIGNSTSYSATVRVTNTTGEDAYLAGWIDFNQDGTFQASEGVVATVADNDTTATLTWTNLSGLAAGDTYYARLRINDAPLTTSDFNGGGSNGEVEDYQVSDPNVLLVKRITAINNTQLTDVEDGGTSTDADNHPFWPANYLVGQIDAGTVQPGDDVEYTVYFLNTGSSAAEGVRFCDRIQPEEALKLAAYGGPDPDVQVRLGTSATLDLSAANDAADRTQFVAGGTTLPATCNLQGANANGTLIFDITGAANTGLPNLTLFPGSTGQGQPNNAYGFFRYTTTINQ